MAETERVTMLWPKELKDAVREKAGHRGITEFTVEAVETHLGVSEDLHGTTKELNEVKYFAQQLADQIVLGIESPEERLQTLMELEFPSWIDTTGWPETYAARVRPDVAEVVHEISPGAFIEVEPAEEIETVEEFEEAFAKGEPVELVTPPEGVKFVPSWERDDAKRDDLFAKVMAKTGGKLDGVPGLKVASELPPPAPEPEPTPEPVRREIDLDDIDAGF